MIRMGSVGILVNEQGKVLLIRRNDTRTFAPPGGGLEMGELPPNNAVREVQEETGVIAMPVRLVGLYYGQARGAKILMFYFRCLQRGGTLQPSSESPQVGFFATNPLPRPMLKVHQQQVEQALVHAGGRPFWEEYRLSLSLKLGYLFMRLFLFPILDWQRRQRNMPPYTPPPLWQTAVTTIITNSDGHVLWLLDGNSWRLPGGNELPSLPPWQTAVQHSQSQLQQAVTLTNLTGVYLAKEKLNMTFTFTAVLENGRIPPNCAYFAPGAEPENSPPAHRQQAADALSPTTETIFTFQE